MHAQPSGVCDIRVGVEAIACTVIAFSKQIRRRLRIVVDGDVVKQVSQRRCASPVSQASRETQLCQRFNLSDFY